MWREGHDEKSVAVAASDYYRWATSKGTEGVEGLYEVIEKHIIPKYGAMSTNDLRYRHIEELSQEIENPYDAKRATSALLKIMEGGFMPFAGNEELRQSVEDNPESDLAQRLYEHGQHILKGLSQ